MGSGPGIACSIRLNTSLTEDQQALYQDEGVIRTLLERSRTVAVVGLSADDQRASHFVASYLQSEGYKIHPVTPRSGTILGEPTFPDLASLPGPVDIVDIFRPPREIGRWVDQAIATGAKAVWTQLKLVDIAAAERARAAGLSVVLDKCVKMEHGRWLGGLHFAGMNTEIVSARRRRR